MKKLLALLLVTVLLVSCSAEAGNGTEVSEEGVKACLITSSGGLGDRSFNDAAYAGLQKAEAELGVEIKVIEPQSSADYLQSIKTAVNAGYDFIMVAGNDWSDVLSTVAPNYPDVKFAGINLSVEGDNVAIAQFSDHEGSFIAGALAAHMSDGKIGAIGGMDIPAIQRFIVGYEEGAKYVNPDIEVVPAYVGSFADPSKGKEFALQLIDEGADVIYQVAGKTGEGLFSALEETEGVYGIGVDQDQDYIVEGKILTSMIKRVDTAVYDQIERVQNGTFEAGTHVYGLAEDGVGISEMQYTKDDIPADVLADIEDIKEKIVNGEIVVTDVFND